MNVFVVATVGAVLIIFITTYIIAFTPLREYIPGYASSKLKRDATELAIKSDSLSVALKRTKLTWLRSRKYSQVISIMPNSTRTLSWPRR
jgi:hypothetical protein